MKKHAHVKVRRHFPKLNWEPLYAGVSGKYLRLGIADEVDDWSLLSIQVYDPKVAK
jgi:hypothetical protein